MQAWKRKRKQAKRKRKPGVCCDAAAAAAAGASAGARAAPAEVERMRLRAYTEALRAAADRAEAFYAFPPMHLVRDLRQAADELEAEARR